MNFGFAQIHTASTLLSLARQWEPLQSKNYFRHDHYLKMIGNSLNLIS